jgi:ABC-2 type transport system ATP-binding protein
VDVEALAALPGVSSAERRGEAMIMHCADSDVAIKALLGAHPDARDIEIAAAGLEQAFLALTGDGDGLGEPAGGAGEASRAKES